MDRVLESRFDQLLRRHAELGAALSGAGISGGEFAKLSKEYSELGPIVDRIESLRRVEAELAAAAEMAEVADDPELKALAEEEVQTLRERVPELELNVKMSLLPKDEDDERNAILEVRAGTGGDEAALFAADLFRMYSRYAERHRWKLEILSQSDAAAGGLKEVIALISSKDGKVYSALKYESGVHRVQRVPATEAQGRIHTSAATVVVLPEVEEVDVKIEDKDLEIKVSRSGGPGGQSVNTTDSAVQILHKPSGIQVRCTDEKSQHKNKDKAMKILRSKLYDIEREKQEASERELRREQVKSGDRSDKIRTYNFPQDRLTDHRIGLTKHNLEDILDGNLDAIIEALRTHYQAEALKGSN
jgi:peptide chain release factor 1